MEVNNSNNYISKFLENYQQKKYKSKELDSETRELKIILHNLEGEEVQLKLDNLLSESEKNEYDFQSSSKMIIPYDDISLFGVYKDNRELISLFNEFIDFLIRYENDKEVKDLLNTTNTNKQCTIKNDKGKINKKYIQENVFTTSLDCNNSLQDSNFLFDINKFSNLFFSSTADKAFYSKIFKYDYISNYDPLFNPSSVKQTTKNYIFTKYKNYIYPNDVIEPDDEYKQIITFYNIYNIVKKLLPINKILYFKVNSKNNTYTQFFVTKEIQINEKYRELNKITNTYVEYHFDINLEKKDLLEYIKININLTGDIKKNNIEFLPQMLDPKDSNYKNNKIYFTNKFKITDTFLNKNVFKKQYGKELDKRLFFLNKELMNFLIEESDSNNESKEGKELSKIFTKNHKNNVDLLIQYFFRQSNDKKHKKKGAIFYKDKEYYINTITNIDYYLGSENNYDSIEVPFKEATIFLEYEDFIVKDNIKVIVDIPRDELYKNNPTNDILAENFQYLQPYKKQYFFTQKKNINSINDQFFVSLKTKIINESNETIEINNINNIPFSSITIVKDADNDSLINNEITEIFYKNKKWELNKDSNDFKSKIANKIFLVKDKGNIIYNNLNPENKANSNTNLKNEYKISLDLNVLDKGAGKITFARKLFSSDCNEKCKNIDKSITETFKPIIGKNNFNFFENLLEKRKNKNKPGIQKILENIYPNENEKENEEKKDETKEKLKTSSNVKLKGGISRVTYKYNKKSKKLSKKKKSRKVNYKKYRNNKNHYKYHKNNKKTVRKFKIKNFKLTKKL